MITTWRGKNRRLIEEAMLEVKKRGIRNPTLIDIAPGAVTQLLSPYFTPEDSLKNDLLSPVDQVLRRTGKFGVHCHEIHEILEVFAPLEPAHLWVLYADADVARGVPENDLVLLNPADINRDNLLEIGDVVFCYNKISEAANPQKSLQNLLHCVKIGGLLSVDVGTDWSLNPRTDPMFIGVSNNLYVKEF